MKVAIIGAGPAGMMAAICASEFAEVHLFEKNEKLGKKLYITGKGRCNITNACEDMEVFENIVRNKKFFYSAYWAFRNVDVMDFFKSQGLELTIERGKRVFPASNKSSDIIKAYEKAIRKSGVKLFLNTEINSLEKDEVFILNKNLKFDKVIIATGGISYSSTGSTGDGYTFAKKFGHKIVDIKPALSAIELDEKNLPPGLSLRNVKLRAISKKRSEEVFGELLFTHTGISGPVTLTMSSLINRWENPELFLDLKPALDDKKLDERILRDFSKYQNKDLKNALKDLFPQNIIDLVIEKADISPDKKINQISREDRKKLVETTKNLKLKFKSFSDLNRAIITSGGVDTKEIDPHSMQSKLVDGLYFCGEVIDLDGFTGGFNLQIANSTGHLAGMGVR